MACTVTAVPRSSAMPLCRWCAWREFHDAKPLRPRPRAAPASGTSSALYFALMAWDRAPPIPAKFVSARCWRRVQNRRCVTAELYITGLIGQGCLGFGLMPVNTVSIMGIAAGTQETSSFRPFPSAPGLIPATLLPDMSCCSVPWLPARYARQW